MREFYKSKYLFSDFKISSFFPSGSMILAVNFIYKRFLNIELILSCCCRTNLKRKLSFEIYLKSRNFCHVDSFSIFRFTEIDFLCKIISRSVNDRKDFFISAVSVHSISNSNSESNSCTLVEQQWEIFLFPTL